MVWLSFCDPDRPKRTQFLGACIVEADDVAIGVTVAHILGINPGGEVAGVVFDEPPNFPQEYVGVLMDRETCEKLDALMENNK